jgi:catechol 2,3-dioxygenase-like lactoylglutathione lyase family enzyme
VSERELQSTVVGVHHVGMSVRSLDDALAFWQRFLGVPARWRVLLDRPYIGQHVGYPGVRIEAAIIDLPGGGVLELLDYDMAERADLPDGTASPGNVHLCLAVEDIAEAWDHARRCGAVPVAPAGPVAVDGGPNAGARASYLRIHDGITLELFQPPRR